MAQSKKPLPVKLICGAIFASEGVLIAAKQRLQKKFGPIDFQGPSISFDFTKYYEAEMGLNLLRQFFSFEKLIDPTRLAAIKIFTNRLEQHFSREKNKPSRTLNLDPGYICASKLVLASCKDYAHRIYLGKGVYAEVTLHFQNGTFQPWPWTYPDYQTKGYLASLHKIREIYIKQIKFLDIYHF